MRKLLSLLLVLTMAAGLLCVGAYASGEPSGEAPAGAASAEPAENRIVTLSPLETDKLIIGPEGYEFTADVHCVRVEVDPAAELTSQYPVIVFFKESDTVANGQIIGNVQFVSDYDEVVAIVHTNDVHGHIEVEPFVKGYADSLKDSGEYSLVLTVSAGDVYGGGEAVANAYNGELIPAIMDKVYDVLAPGNNDYTITGCVRQNLLLSALYDHTRTICANVVTKDTGLAEGEFADGYEPVCGRELFDELYDRVTTAPDGSLDLSGLGLADLEPAVSPYPHTAVFTTDKGTAVGLFGLTTSGGALDTELDGTGSIAGAQAGVEELREAGATVIVALGHTGWLGEGATGGSSNDTNSWQLTNTVAGLDAFVDGHTHSIINEGQGVLEGEDSCLLNQAQSFGYCIGVMFLYVKDGQVLAADGNVLQDMTGITPDPEVQELVDRALAKVKEDFGKPVAETPYFLNGERMSAGNEGGTVRGNETNLGDLMTDVMLAACEEKMGTDYAFIAYPGYWLRASIPEGDITMESLQSVFANPTVLYHDTFTADAIVSMVQRGLNSVAPEKEENTFNQYSGIRVTYRNNGGTGTPETIEVDGTLIYDAGKGGVQVGADWSCEGIYTMTGGEIDSWNAAHDNQPGENWICIDKTEVQKLVADWLAAHTLEEYSILPNVPAPDGRIVPVN